MNARVNRRTVLQRAALAGTGAALAPLLPAWARTGTAGVAADAPGSLA